MPWVPRESIRMAVWRQDPPAELVLVFLYLLNYSWLPGTRKRHILHTKPEQEHDPPKCQQPKCPGALITNPQGKGPLQIELSWRV